MSLESLAVIYNRTKKHYANAKIEADKNISDQFLQNCKWAAERQLSEAREAYFRELRNFQAAKGNRRNRHLLMLEMKRKNVGLEIADIFSRSFVFVDSVCCDLESSFAFTGTHEEHRRLKAIDSQYQWLVNEIKRCNVQSPKNKNVT